MKMALDKAEEEGEGVEGSVTLDRGKSWRRKIKEGLTAGTTTDGLAQASEMSNPRGIRGLTVGRRCVRRDYSTQNKVPRTLSKRLSTFFYHDLRAGGRDITFCEGGVVQVHCNGLDLSR